MAGPFAAKLVGAAATALAASDAKARGAYQRSVTVPTGLGWDSVNYPLGTVTVTERLGAPAYGSVGLNPFSSAQYAACVAGTQYYVQLTGNDANAGTSVGSPLATIDKAVQLANATGQPATINLIGGTSSTYLGRVPSTFGVTKPAVDLLLRPVGTARVMLGSFDLGTYTWSDNATYSWVKQVARSNALRLVNPATLTARGLWADYTKVTSLLLCSQTPGSWFTDNTNVYVNPFAGQALSDGTVRILLNVNLFNWTPNGSNALPNIFLENLDYVGGASSNLLVLVGAPASSWPRRMFAARNCSFRYGGGAATGSGGVYINGWNGLVYFEGCDAGGSWSDAWNWHNDQSPANATMNAITINCTGFDTGRGGAAVQSNNGLTGHDSNLVAIDIAGDYGDARGRTVHFTDTSKLWCVATRAGPSYGDIGNGGSFTPVEFFADNTVQMWLDGVDPRPMGAANYGILAGGSSTINVRNLPATARTATITSGSVVAY